MSQSYIRRPRNHGSSQNYRKIRDDADYRDGKHARDNRLTVHTHTAYYMRVNDQNRNHSQAPSRTPDEKTHCDLCNEYSTPLSKIRSKPKELVQNDETTFNIIEEVPKILSVDQAMEQMSHRPEIVHPSSFKFAVEFAKELSVAANELLKVVPSTHDEAMRLEFYPADKEWKLCLKIDPVTWYDNLQTNNKVDVARTYIDSERQISHQTKEPKSYSFPLIEVAEYCEFPARCCTYGSKCWKKHSSIFCSMEVQRRGSFKRPCNWHAPDELIMETTEQKEFLLMSQPQFYRDLLFVPHPMCNTSGWLQHYSNRQLCCMPYFWKSLITICNELAELVSAEGSTLVQKVAFNFGTWGTEMSLGHRALDWHGYAHIELTRDAAENLQTYYPVLVGRTNAPEDYREKNCRELEVSRVLSQEVRRIYTIVGNIEQMLKNLNVSSLHTG